MHAHRYVIKFYNDVSISVEWYVMSISCFTNMSYSRSMVSKYTFANMTLVKNIKKETGHNCYNFNNVSVIEYNIFLCQFVIKPNEDIV